MNTTRKYSRTMEQAFGPGHRGGLWVEPEPMHLHDKIVLLACAVTLPAMIAALFIWG